jgi:hypothetical protein
MVIRQVFVHSRHSRSGHGKSKESCQEIAAPKQPPGAAHGPMQSACGSGSLLAGWALISTYLIHLFA